MSHRLRSEKFRYAKTRSGKMGEMAPVRSFSPAVEDYLKAIYRLQGEAGDPVTTSALGSWLGVTAPSASGMLKKLDDLRLVVYVPYRGVRLTEAGRRAALGVVRRHRLLEAFLAEALGLSWDQVHDEAEVLEHAVSPGLCEAIAARLGDPRTDPHGDPIPTRDGRVTEAPARDLGSLAPGQRARVTRVSDRDPAILRFLTARGIALGDVLEVREVHPGGAVTVQARSGPHLLSAAVTAAIRVAASR
jgi:DtxR family Mn-dependent transcriptional regulator